MFARLKAGYWQPSALLCASLLLVACSGPAVIRDSGPSGPVDVSSIPNAEPRFEARTRAGNKSPYSVLGKTYRVLPESDGFKEQGIASWYGNKFHGRRTSNGEIYNMYGMTAAHKNLPIPSYVKVTNLDNGRSIVVRVNDRGPFHEGRVIDLSYAGASKLDYLKQGTARVEVEALPMAAGYSDVTTHAFSTVSARAADVKALPRTTVPEQSQLPASGEQAGHRLPNNTFLQVGAFSRQLSAQGLQQRVAALTSLPVRLSNSAGAKSLWRVQVGPVESNLVVMNLRAALESEGLRAGHLVYE